MVTVWFDGGCPLCRREIAMMRRLDRRGAIRFVDLDPARSCPLTQPLGSTSDTLPDRAVLLARFHAEEDGQIHDGAAAFAAMWRAIPLLRPLGLAARNRVVLAVLEWSYDHFLRVRPILQRLVRRGGH